MMDRDDRHPEHDRSRRDDALPGESSLGKTGRVAWVAASRQSPAQGDPTDPEVPTAKRRGALQRQRSLFALCLIVMGLLSIALFLLYRTSLKVTSSRSSPIEANMSSASPTDGASPANGRAAGAGLTARTPSPGTSNAQTRAHLSERPETDVARAAASATPRSKSAAPAGEIIRTPSF